MGVWQLIAQIKFSQGDSRLYSSDPICTVMSVQEQKILGDRETSVHAAQHLHFVAWWT